MQSISQQVAEDGAVSWQTNRFTELANGFGYWDGQAWQPTVEEFEIVNGHALAAKGPIQAILAGNITEAGAVDLITSDGQRFVSNPRLLSFHDTATGRDVLIAQVTETVGALPAPNVVFYPLCFDNGVNASVRYTYTASGMEQDLVFHNASPNLDPATYGMNPATTRLEMWSEFFTPPVPDKTMQPLADGAIDQTLHFGAVMIGRGRMFASDGDGGDVPVAKTWAKIENRDWLIESVAYSAFTPLLEKLHANNAAPKAGKRLVANQPVKDRAALLAQLAGRGGQPAGTAQSYAFPSFSDRKAQIAATPAKWLIQPSSIINPLSQLVAVIWDYTILNVNKTNYTFQGDTTYYISAGVTLRGSNTVFEAGTVIKFAPTNSAKLTLISTNITWGGSPYLPVVLTARDDHSVGEKIGTNSLSGYYADTALDIDALTPGTTVTLQNLRIANAQTAININGKNGHRIDHFQCVTAKVGLQLGTATNSVTLRNALFHNVNTNLLGVSGATVSAEHLTVDTASNLNHAAALTLNLTNSLLVAVNSTNGITAQDSVTAISSGIGIFTTVGSASHYLADDTHRNSGSANVSILSDIHKTTTYPPIVLSGDFTVDMTLNPQAGRPGH